MRVWLCAIFQWRNWQQPLPRSRARTICSSYILRLAHSFLLRLCYQLWLFDGFLSATTGTRKENGTWLAQCDNVRNFTWICWTSISQETKMPKGKEFKGTNHYLLANQFTSLAIWNFGKLTKMYVVLFYQFSFNFLPFNHLKFLRFYHLKFSFIKDMDLFY